MTFLRPALIVAAAPGAGAAQRPPAATPIRHLIVVVGENVSFDALSDFGSDDSGNRDGHGRDGS